MSAPSVGYGYRNGSVAVEEPPVETTAADAPWPTLPLGALRYAAGGLLGGFVAASVVATICVGLGLSTYSPVTVVADLIALWVFLLGAAVQASRRLGTGSLRRDYRLAFEPLDAARGAGASVLGRIAVTVVTGVILAIAGHKVAGNTEVLRQQQGHPLHLFVVGAGAVIGAPIVEELFFRGLVLRALASRIAFKWSVVIQGVLFGMAHAQTGQNGYSVLAVVAGTAAFGMVQGWFAARWRLGALMVSHGLYNLLPVLYIAFS